MSSESSFASDLTRKGPARFTRRIIMVVAVLLLPFVLRALKWKGWRDCGWNHPRLRKGALRDFGLGAGMGLLIMLILFAASIILGTRTWSVSYSMGKLVLSIFSYLFAALVVGVLEETIARGVLFRLLIKRWAPVPVLLIVAIAFAWLHFLSADPATYEAGPFLQRAGNVLASSATGFIRIPHALVEMTNLALFSILLCLMYLRSHSIWLPAGFHAGVVYIKRLNGIVADSDKTHVLSTFAGNSSDYTNGWLCAILLIVLIAVLWKSKKPLPGDGTIT
jgi:membrane protease YdiL (CAAX protease family)